MKKSVEAFSLPVMLRKQITALVQTGYYSSRSDVVKDALRSLVETKPYLQVAVALYLYKEKMITKDEALFLCRKTEKEFMKLMRSKK